MSRFNVLQSRGFVRALALAICLLPTLTMKASSQSALPVMSLSLVDDWSTGRVVYSSPQSMEQATALRADPRYQQQWLRHERPLSLGEQAPMSVERFAVPGMTSMMAAAQRTAARAQKPKPQTTSTEVLKQDWATSLLAGGKVGDGMYPAKYTFDATAAPSCSNDFVAFNTSLAGAAAATRTGTFSAAPSTPPPNAGATVNGTALTLTPSVASTTGTLTSAMCISGGQGITINGVSITTNATNGTSTISFGASNATANNTMTVAGETTSKVYKFVGSLTGAANEVLIGLTSVASLANLYSAITGGAGAGTTYGTGTTAHPDLTAADPAGGTSMVLTSKCGGVQAAVTATKGGGAPGGWSDAESVSNGTTSGTTFAIDNQANSTTRATNTAANIASAINTNSGTTLVTAVAASGTITLTATTAGTAANSIALTTTIGAGFTWATSTLTGGLAASDTGSSFTAGASATAAATNLAAAINRVVSGVVATSNAGVVTVTASTRGTAGNSIALAESLANFTWAGATLTGGTASQPSIVAFNNLYSTDTGVSPQGLCGGSGPSIKWSYDTGPGTVVTSPILSLDGTKIIYVDTSASGAVLHILQLNSGGEGTLSGAIAPSVVSNWGSCSVGNSCVIDIPFSGGPQVTKSSPFYDYTNDTLYVGDNAGKLHKFTPVVNGTPVEVTANPWPMTVDSGVILNGPLVDMYTGQIFVTSASKIIRVSLSGTPAVTHTVTPGGSIVDSAMMDVSTGKVFAFSTLGGGTVLQYTGSTLALDTSKTISDGSTSTATWTGAFDNNYFAGGPSTPYMYACGVAGGNGRAALYRISMTGGSLGTVSSAVPLVNGGGNCSPVTTFYNAATGMDWLFLSVGNKSSTPAGTNWCGATNSNSGCLMSLNITGTAWPPTSMTAGYVTSNTGGNPSTSGVVVDNAGGTTTVPRSSLTAAITSGAASFDVADATGFAVNDYIQVDLEAMQITGIAGNTLSVTRGLLSTTAASHLINTVVVDLRETLLNSVGGITAVATTITVDSTTTFNVNDYIQIDSEAMKITGRTTTTLTVDRNQLGTSAATHANDARVSSLSRYPQAASIYFTNAENVTCNGTAGLGCAVKLTQSGLK